MHETHCHPDTPSPCRATCERAASRRAFLRDLGLAAMGTIAVSGLIPAVAWGGTVEPLLSLGRRQGEVSYAVPAQDGVSIDEAAGVVLVRWQRHLYAFSSECPHRGATLTYLPDEQRIYCRKHKARFAPDGAWQSGKQTAPMDRFPLRVDGGQLYVRVDAPIEADRDPAGYAAASAGVP